LVSVAGCLGYDVLENSPAALSRSHFVSVAGCLGYDVLGLGV
jgi:quinol monooxygenase YgiN